MAQEALHNVERHAHASRVVVRLANDPGLLCLDVSDDGCGFDPAQLRQGGLGLAGMQERARLIGASFDVSSRPGTTRVRLSLRPEPGRAVAGSPPVEALKDRAALPPKTLPPKTLPPKTLASSGAPG